MPFTVCLKFELVYGAGDRLRRGHIIRRHIRSEAHTKVWQGSDTVLFHHSAVFLSPPCTATLHPQSSHSDLRSGGLDAVDEEDGICHEAVAKAISVWDDEKNLSGQHLRKFPGEILNAKYKGQRLVSLRACIIDDKCWAEGMFAASGKGGFNLDGIDFGANETLEQVFYKHDMPWAKVRLLRSQTGKKP